MTTNNLTLLIKMEEYKNEFELELVDYFLKNNNQQDITVRDFVLKNYLGLPCTDLERQAFKLWSNKHGFNRLTSEGLTMNNNDNSNSNQFEKTADLDDPNLNKDLIAKEKSKDISKDLEKVAKSHCGPSCKCKCNNSGAD